MYFILDKSKSMGKTFSKLVMPACAYLYRKIAPDGATAVFFGQTVTSFSVTSSTFFDQDDIKNMELEEATDIGGGFSKAMETALKDKETLERDFESRMFDKIQEETKKLKAKLKEEEDIRIARLKVFFQSDC